MYDPLVLPEEILKRYIGNYRGWVVSLGEGQLYLTSPDGLDRMKMSPITETMFTGDMDYHVRFELGEDNKAEALIWLPRLGTGEMAYARTT